MPDRIAEFRTFLVERSGSRVFVEYLSTDGLRSLVGTVLSVGEATFQVRTDREPVRTYMLALDSLRGVREAQPHAVPSRRRTGTH